MQLTVLTGRPVLGSFSKATDGAASLNYAQSGGQNCDLRCAYHPDNHDNPTKNKCYAARSERRHDRKELVGKLKRHEEAGAEAVTLQALAELKDRYDKGKPVPWFRFSAFGSIPMPADASPEFLDALRELLDFCDANSIPVHLPAETLEKAQFYQQEIGTRATVRVSSMSEAEFIASPMAASFVAGVNEMSRIERVVEAKRVASSRYQATGRRTIVCPAVASRSLEAERLKAKGVKGYQHAAGSANAKCGKCTACAQPGYDIIYPMH